MSRVGKLPITIPSGVSVKVEATEVEVQGPKGCLKLPLHPIIRISVDDNVINLAPVDESRIARQQHGLRRTLLANAVTGVTKGFEKTLEVIGVGYKVNVQGNIVVLNVGFSHPVNFELPTGVQAKVENNKIILSGCDKQVVGEVAAQIRRVREPEPYKGKGIKYSDETIRRKAGKSGGKK
jgi:large subunit ribosomal protein L6